MTAVFPRGVCPVNEEYYEDGYCDLLFEEDGEICFYAVKVTNPDPTPHPHHHLHHHPLPTPTPHSESTPIPISTHPPHTHTHTHTHTHLQGGCGLV